ncbi:aldehyde dehydrogenase family protein [Gordonia shandongensis]|uniref:aldehyde dehydrogenase family protein n=1 Tax=Gordonia shandongensis TaxID=376351 RepID=UPI00040F21D2|nr:aldehyde dehydrogenase family protein [Gordonia shandongensis]
MTEDVTLLDAVAATSGGEDLPVSSRFDVLDPATGDVLAQAPDVSVDQLDGVFAVALDAFGTWRHDEAFRRSALRRAAELIEERIDELAEILTAEQGKPLAEARSEFAVSAMWLRYYADLDLPSEVLVNDEAAGYQAVVRRPMGVVAAIAPWNFPISLAVWKIAPALRAGNTIVVKPSPHTPLATLALGQVLRAAFPPGVLNVVSGLDPLGAAMVEHPVPRKVSFTGSTAVGRKVALGAAADLKRVTLELGGNDPAVILPDVDVDEIAPSLYRSAFANAGQICLAVKRVYVHDSIKARLVEALGEIARSVTVGSGMTEGVQMGPVNNRAQLDRVVDLVDDAVEAGARVVAGGAAIDRPGYFYAPTIVEGASDGVRLVDEEQFGPALPIIGYTEIEDAIARANRTEYGLTASVWSGDPERAAQWAPRIEAGQVAINAHGTGVRPDLPFGGLKSSGLGVENGPWGLYSFTEIQVVTGPHRP